jgi:hypothetical protein
VALALGGDCLADIAMLRAQPELFGPVAFDPVVSRLVTRLAGDAPHALKAIRAARADARAPARAEPSPVPNAAPAVRSTTAHTEVSTAGRFDTPPRRARTTASCPDAAVAEMAGTSAAQKPDSAKGTRLPTAATRTARAPALSP